MDDLCEDMDKIHIKNWSIEIVQRWLRQIGLREKYIRKFYEEEIDGQCLLILTYKYLEQEIHMKSGPVLLLMTRREQLIDRRRNQGEWYESEGLK